MRTRREVITTALAEAHVAWLGAPPTVDTFERLPHRVRDEVREAARVVDAALTREPGAPPAIATAPTDGRRILLLVRDMSGFHWSFAGFGNWERDRVVVGDDGPCWIAEETGERVAATHWLPEPDVPLGSER